MIHKLLQKQLEKLAFKDGKFPEKNLEKFIGFVNASYYEGDEERDFLVGAVYKR